MNEKPKWRLLNVGETLQQFDEYYSEDRECWCVFPENPEGEVLTDEDSMFRRPMTPAEVNAEELLASIVNYFDALGCDSDEGHALMRMEKAVCAATGREMPAMDQMLDALLNPDG